MQQLNKWNQIKILRQAGGYAQWKERQRVEQLRAKQNKQATVYRKDYAIFEQVVNRMMTSIDVVNELQFDIKVDQKNQLHHLGIHRIIPKLSPAVRFDGRSGSRPDGILMQVNSSKPGQMIQRKKLMIVYDAKFYHSEVPPEAIYKLLEDAELRETENIVAYPLLIFSEQAKYIQDESQLKQTNMEKKLRTVQLETFGDHEEYLDQAGDYQNQENESTLLQMVQRIVEDFQQMQAPVEDTTLRMEKILLKGTKEMSPLPSMKLSKQRRSRSQYLLKMHIPKKEESNLVAALSQFKKAKKNLEERKKDKDDGLQIQAEQIVKELKEAAHDEFKKALICQKYKLSLTKKNLIARRSKLGKVVFDLLVEGIDDFEDCLDIELETNVPLELNIPELNQLQLQDETKLKPLQSQLKQAQKNLLNFYEDLIKNPKKKNETVNRGSVKTGTQTILRVLEELEESYLDPYPYDEDWCPTKKNALNIPWLPRYDEKSQTFKRAYMVNAPFNWIGQDILIVMKATAANYLFKTRICFLLPYDNWFGLDPLVKNFALEQGAKVENLGRIVYSGYQFPPAFDTAMITWK